MPTTGLLKEVAVSEERLEAASSAADPGAPRHRQAVVIVHGMGEQHPMETLVSFVDTALRADYRRYYSRPESVTGSYESRRFLVPRIIEDASTAGASPDAARRLRKQAREILPQTELFEYHWADKMQGNRIDDLWPTLRRMLLIAPSRVPQGLTVVWAVAWLVILALAWMFGWGPWSDIWAGDGDVVGRLVSALVSGGVAAAALSFLLSRALPNWLSSSFVDVVRYLDTSPRSYAARRDIRKGLVEMLTELHEAEYDRIVIVAHSLGGFIAYDAVAYLWGRMNRTHAGKLAPQHLPGLVELERAASALDDPVDSRDEALLRANQLDTFQSAQRLLFEGLRANGNDWRISDLVTVGTPMYFADRLLAGTGRHSFRARVERREMPTCPPQNEEAEYNNINVTKRYYSYRARGPGNVKRRVLFEGAPFAVVRWTNLYFPARLHFFGDWFGGPLRPLFGAGIRDVVITGNRPRDRRGASLIKSRLSPGWAHALYFSFADDEAEDGAASQIRDALDLHRRSWPRPQ